MRLVASLAAVLIGLGSAALNAAPAQAHGALTNPISRAATCGDVGHPNSPVCRAALSASGVDIIDWPNLRLPNVNGRDRDVVPDGRLCSAGKPEFAGLDLVRRDWPVTTLTAGSRFTFSYGQTIPHEGTFRLYMTKAGYDPSQPLRWSDLPTEPFAQVTDPPLRGNAYTFAATLPNRAGRHLIYTIWQNSSTPDTYYSCSDVFLAQAAPAQPPAAPVVPDAPAPGAPSIEPSPAESPAADLPAAESPAAESPVPAQGGAGPVAEPSAENLARTAAQPARHSLAVPLLVGGAFAAFALVGAVFFMRRRRQQVGSYGRHG